MTTEPATPAPGAADTPAEQPAPPAQDTQRGRMSFDDALAAMAKARETAQATPPEPADEGEGEPETNTLDDQDSGDGDASDVDAETEDGAEEGEEEEAEEGEEDAGDDPVVKLADGSEVPLSELTKGYLRQADYTKKAQALSEQRKQAESVFGELTEAQKSYQDKAERYGSLIEALDKLVDTDGEKWSKVDWKALKDDDPHEFLIQREEYREWQDKKGAVQAEAARLKAEREGEHRKAVEQAQGALRGKLSEVFPQWADNTVLRAETQAMAATAQAIGFSQEEMAATLDPRAWQLLWKAAQYDRLQKSQKGVKNGAATKAAPDADKPQPMRVLKASGPRPTPRGTAAAQVRSLKAKAFKTGSLEDAYQAYTASRRSAR